MKDSSQVILSACVTKIINIETKENYLIIDNFELKAFSNDFNYAYGNKGSELHKYNLSNNTTELIFEHKV